MHSQEKNFRNILLRKTIRTRQTVVTYLLQVINPFNFELVDNYLRPDELYSQDANPSWLHENVEPDHKEYLLLGLNKVNNELFNLPKLYPCWYQDGNTTTGMLD